MDKTTNFARSVSTGSIVAGPAVRAAAARHLRDMEAAGSNNFGYRFVPGKAERAIKLFPTLFMLTKIVHERFVLLPWQAFIVGSIYGWVSKDDEGIRRFRRVYVETGKGSGKTPLGAAFLILNALQEPRAEVFSVAKTKEQASIAFDEARSMILANDRLKREFKIIGGSSPRRIIRKKDNSTIDKLSSENKQSGKSGPLTSLALIDEYHEHDTSDMLDFCVAGFKARRNPLCFIITNAGRGMQTPCYEERITAMRACESTHKDDLHLQEYLAYVCDLDEGDDITDPGVWPKTNPSLPSIPSKGYLERQISQAAVSPSKASLMERLAFCRWQDAESPWVTGAALDAVTIDELPEVKGKPCYLALDLSRTTDTTALAYVWDMGDYLACKVDVFAPGNRLPEMQRKYKAEYEFWAREGHLRAIAGATISFKDVTEIISDAVSKHNVVGMAYDTHKIEELKEWLQDTLPITDRQTGAGLWMVKHWQGFKRGALTNTRAKGKTLYMPNSIDTLQAELFAKRLKILRNPVVRFSILGSVVVEDGKKNPAYTKTKAQAPDDAIVSLTMACGFAIDCRKPKRADVGFITTRKKL